MAAHGGGPRLLLVTVVTVLCLVPRCSADEFSNRTRRQAISDGGRTINTGYFSEYCLCYPAAKHGLDSMDVSMLVASISVFTYTYAYLIFMLY